MKKNYLLFIFALFAFSKSYSQPAGWTYNVPFVITENSGTLVTDYQAKITVNTQNLIGLGQMLSTGDDIRFGKDCAGNTMYNYWIESGINTSTTTIWVKIDTLFPSSARTFFMFYGNSSATAASAIPGTFSGPMSSTDSVASGAAGGVTSSQRGFRFSPNEDLLVTAFGKLEPTGTTRYVTLFDNATQAILAQEQVTGPAGQYSYQNITTPIWLLTGTQYLLELYQGSSDGYYFGNSSQIGQQLTYYDMRYCNGCTQNTFPTNTLTNYQYGYPDLWYWRKNNVIPAPSVVQGAVLVSNPGSDVTYCFGNSATIGGVATGGSGAYTYSWTPTNNLSSINTATTIANPTVTTVYTLTVTDGCGSVADSSVTVNVNPLPLIAATAVNDSVCPGGNADVIVTGTSTSYVWMPGNSTSAIYNVFPAATTTYSVTGIDVNGCVDSTTVTVTVETLPTVSVTGTYSSICDNANTSLTMTANGASTYSWNPGNGTGTSFTDTPSASTTYTVIGTDALGCNDTTNYSVTFLPHPTALTAASDDTICNGICVNIVGTAFGGTPGYTYMWAPTGSTASSITDCPTTSTCYVLIIADANGCADTANSCVLVNPLPAVTFTSTLNTVCLDDGAVTLTGGSPAGGTYSGTGVSGSTFTPMTAGNGTHTLTYFFTDVNGCSDSATHNVLVNPCTGINEAVVNGDVSVYPNPFSTKMTITRASSSDVTVNLFDAQGKLIMSKKTNGTEIEIETAGLADGIYSLQLIDTAGTKTFRVAKNN